MKTAESELCRDAIVPEVPINDDGTESEAGAASKPGLLGWDSFSDEH
jgi:hypothetical protein